MIRGTRCKDTSCVNGVHYAVQGEVVLLSYTLVFYCCVLLWCSVVVFCCCAAVVGQSLGEIKPERRRSINKE